MANLADKLLNAQERIQEKYWADNAYGQKEIGLEFGVSRSLVNKLSK